MFWNSGCSFLQQAWVSIGRLEEFLALPELAFRKGEGVPGSIKIVDGSFRWTQDSSGQEAGRKESESCGEPKTVLKNVSVAIAPGQLVAVIGEVLLIRNSNSDSFF